ncbi:SH3 domain-containing protein [Bacillus sp. AGMB 02131]|uniref:SH3 domain-containing protein n=1 Tax=Peribacillus faecalis TaxID=2772559 RepID=A0A927D133_9BACI|nr:SH3 domain-containing protein [Peribacillus faecalis]MBD3109615.1 SH3 domain-containing protein [Peribacillus faecalis]
MKTQRINVLIAIILLINGFLIFNVPNTSIAATVNTVNETAYNAKGTIICAAGLNVRKSPDTAAAIIGGVSKNTVVTIAGQAGSFYKIKFGNGYGYISNDSRYIKIQSTATNSTVSETAYNAKGTIICASGLNVRKSPSTSAARIGGVSNNTVVTIVGQAGSFYKIKFGNGYGYISNDSRYIKIQSTATNSTVSETAYNAKGTIICASGLNVRKSPSTSAARIGGVSNNTVVTIVGQAGSFYKIKFGNDYGYISNDSKYIKIQTSNSKPAMTEQEVFREALAFTLKWEGGYVNHKYDLGGATNKGITQRTYNKYRDQINKPRQSVKYISNSEVEAIYYEYYWKPVKANRMERTLAIVMFDTAVNLGVNGSTKDGGAIKHLQKALNVTATGYWGYITENAFSKILKNDHYSLALKVNKHTQDYRYERVKQDPTQKVFLQGWLNRDKALHNYITKIGR